MVIEKKKTTKKTKSQPNRPSLPSLSIKLTSEEKRWQAQDDARILAQAEDVKNNASRLKAAKIQAKKMAKEQEVTLNSLKKIAGK